MLELEMLFVSTELEIAVKFPDAPKMLEELKKDYDLYLLSNNVSDILVRQITEKCGINGFFKEVFVSSDIAYRKPHRIFINEVISRTGLLPQDCIMIGDRLSQDIIMANDTGMQSVFAAMVDHEDNHGMYHISYTWYIETLAELIPLLKKEG
jgi:putative hydrolase of the HAD superfamily